MDEKRLSAAGAIALNAVFGDDPATAVKIVEALGSTYALFGLSDDELKTLFGPESKYTGKISRYCMDAADEEYERLGAKGVSFLSITDEDYPCLLRECPDAPVLLYVRSTSPISEIFNSRPLVSIVGTRDLDLYGQECCRSAVMALAKAGQPPAIVSGLAIGADIKAHLSALDASIPTIAVSPVGIDDIYPKRHCDVASRIIRSPGSAIITDYPPGTVPRPEVFLRRNRIIAGISAATILVESRAKGGGMMTARLASGYGRPVYAFPGRCGDQRSEGCNILISKNVAEIIPLPSDLPAMLGLGKPARKSGSLKDMHGKIAEALDGKIDRGSVESAWRIYSLTHAQSGISYDEICSLTGLRYNEVSFLALMLENAGFIRSDMFQRCSINDKYV